MQFFRFCIVGGGVFIVDIGVFALVEWYLAHPFYSRILSFWVAVVLSWAGHYFFSFQRQQQTRRWPSLIRYVVACHGTGLLNFGVFSLLVAIGADVYFSFVFGVLVGLGANYIFAKHIFLYNRTRFKLSNSRGLP